MRWDDLFADLDAEAEMIAARQRAVEVEDLTRAEVSRVGLVQRLLPSIGATVRARCPAEVWITGRLERVGPDWLLMDEGSGRTALVVLPAVLSIGGAVRLSAGPDGLGQIASRLTLPSALRGLAPDRASVRIHLRDGATVSGTIDRVGADFLELATHPGDDRRRRGEVREVLVLPNAAVSVIRSGD